MLKIKELIESSSIIKFSDEHHKSRMMNKIVSVFSTEDQQNFFINFYGYINYKKDGF